MIVTNAHVTIETVMPKNILFTSWYTGLGGGETDLLSIAAFLDPHQWTPHLVVPNEGALADRWRDHGWQVHVVSYRGASTFFIPSIWAWFPSVENFRKLLIENQIDVISSEYHTLPMIHAAAQSADVPIMWTVHGWWFKPKFWQRDFFRHIPIVARSHSIRDGFVGSPPFMSPKNIPVIYSGVDIDRFVPDAQAKQRELANIGIQKDVPLIAMVARFQPVKGHHRLQSIIPKVVQQIPDVQFIVAGEDTFGVAKDEAYRQQMLDNANSDPVLSEHLHYIGFRDDVESVLAAADVVICASDFESYGKVNIEAMACGTPVVSTNRGGPSETVIDGETGYLVSPDEIQDFVDCLTRLLSAEVHRKQFGEQARRHILANFSARRAANQYDAFLRELLKTP